MTGGAQTWLLIAAGGALGATARHGVGRLALAALGPGFPWATVAVNVVGSFAMGALVHGLAMRGATGGGSGEGLRAFLALGFLGAFTTFSTFSLDAYYLYANRGLSVAGLYVVGSVVASLAGFAGGLLLARAAS